MYSKTNALESVALLGTDNIKLFVKVRLHDPRYLLTWSWPGHYIFFKLLRYLKLYVVLLQVCQLEVTVNNISPRRY